MTFVLGMAVVEGVGGAIPLKPKQGLNGAPELLLGDSDGAAEAVPLLSKPQVLRLRLRMTFVLGMAIIQDDICSWNGDYSG
jgi:hypothetical protein